MEKITPSEFTKENTDLFTKFLVYFHSQQMEDKALSLKERAAILSSIEIVEDLMQREKKVRHIEIDIYPTLFL